MHEQHATRSPHEDHTQQDRTDDELGAMLERELSKERDQEAEGTNKGQGSEDELGAMLERELSKERDQQGAEGRQRVQQARDRTKRDRTTSWARCWSESFRESETSRQSEQTGILSAFERDLDENEHRGETSV